MVDAAVFQTEVLTGREGSSPFGSTIATFERIEPMAKAKEQMDKLLAERDRLAAQIAGLQHELAGLDRAIRVLKGEHGAPLAAKPRVAVKDVVLGLLDEFRETGLSAGETVERAYEREIALDRASVSSLLSRLKREGILTFDGSKYRIASREKSALESAIPTLN